MTRKMSRTEILFFAFCSMCLLCAVAYTFGAYPIAFAFGLIGCVLLSALVVTWIFGE